MCVCVCVCVCVFQAEKKVALLRAELEAMQARHASTTAALQAAHDAALAQERQQAATVQEVRYSVITRVMCLHGCALACSVALVVLG